MCIRKKLLNQRLKEKIRAKEVANYIGISPVALSRFENGHTDMKSEHIEKYAKYLGLEIRLLIK